MKKNSNFKQHAKKATVKKNKKMLHMFISYFIVFIVLSVLLCVALHRSPEYTDKNTEEVSGIVSGVRTESYLTGYKSRSRTRVIITFDNGEEYHRDYSVLIKNMGQNYNEFCEKIQGNEVTIHHNNSMIVSLNSQGQEFLSYEVSNHASKSIRIGAILVYFIALMGCGLYIWLKFDLKS